ncbi:condensation domain-containing protein [Streptomyces sp. NPDC018045]|uniref:condensation domain-containing protein n=1 Tax=Streptomyces sp. NPDC018045 TaxID=3365037 RepID=UPI003788CA2A
MTPAHPPATTAPESRAPDREDVTAHLTAWLEEAALVPDPDPEAPLRDLGVDSLDLIRAARQVDQVFGVHVPLRDLLADALTLPGLVRLVLERAGTRRGPSAHGLAHPFTVLAPPQEQAWETQPPQRDQWNQAMLFTTGPDVDPTTLQDAVRRLVAGHQSLRLAFDAKPARRPEQRAEALGADDRLPDVFDVVDLTETPDDRLSEAVTLRCAVEQRSLDLRAGRVLRVVWFDAGSGRRGRLLVVAHQLTVDMLSWSVLLADLQDLYLRLAAGDTEARCDEGTPYLRWAEALAAYARTPEAEQEAVWWNRVARTPGHVPLDVPHADPWAANTAATAATHREEFTKEETEALLTRAPGLLGCHPGEVVLHALGETLAAWRGGDAVRLDILSHGREETVGDVDLTRTTGWFTTTVPISLDLSPGTPHERVARTHGHLAALPTGGVGHGALRQHGRPRISAALRGAEPSAVSYDYEGSDADDVPLGELLLDVADEPVGDITAPDWVRPHLIEVIVTTDDGVLCVEWWYSTALHHHRTIQRLAADHRAALRALLV